MAWKFRQEFQARLGIVFDHMSTIYHSFPGRITAETFKKQILAIVEVWEDWIVFSPEFTKELRDRLDGKEDREEATTEGTEGIVQDQEGHAEIKVYESKFKASSFKPATEEAQAEAVGEMDGESMDCERGDVDGVPMDDVDGEPLDGEPLDGEPLDGEPWRGDDLDGEPMKDIDEDLDGDPMDESVDGAQMSLE
jgi:U2-associated protein SR140